MNGAPDFVFFQISSKEAADAYAFHQSSSSDEYIWPRTQQDIQQFCDDGELFGVKNVRTGKYVGLCYIHLDEGKQEWELGGLVVSDAARGLRIGSVLASIALAHTIANHRPWAYGQEVIAHVHEYNQKPRNVLQNIGFEHIGKTPPVPNAPPSMKRNPSGEVVGDIFRFPKQKMKQLSEWLNAYDGRLANGAATAIVEVGQGGIESLREALNEAARVD